MPTKRLVNTKNNFSHFSSGEGAYKANSYNCSNATSKVVSLNGTWKTDSISFTVDPLYRYTVHVRNSASIGATSINIDFIEVYGEASASYLTCIEDSGGYRFGFNSMPKDNEIYGPEGSGYDFGARIYDSRLGRFLSVDPLTKVFSYWSPYNFSGNSPILFINRMGKNPVLPILSRYLIISIIEHLTVREAIYLTASTIGSDYLIENSNDLVQIYYQPSFLGMKGNGSLYPRELGRLQERHRAAQKELDKTSEILAKQNKIEFSSPDPSENSPDKQPGNFLACLKELKLELE